MSEARVSGDVTQPLAKVAIVPEKAPAVRALMNFVSSGMLAGYYWTTVLHLDILNPLGNSCWGRLSKFFQGARGLVTFPSFFLGLGTPNLKQCNL